eukprot:gene40171-49681_t
MSKGLVAYYPFNGNTFDYSGNGNHGRNYGAILSADRSNNPQNSFAFDGSTSYIEIPP